MGTDPKKGFLMPEWTYEIDENGFVCLPGSEDWRSSYDDGANLNQRFPNADSFSFALAIGFNDVGPLVPGIKITDLMLLQTGENDGASWIWKVTLHDGSVWKMSAWCDYTGWDCQSGNSWEPFVPAVHDCPTCKC